MFVVGIGLEYWLGHTALDAIREGFQTYVISDASRALTLPTTTLASASASASASAASSTTTTSSTLSSAAGSSSTVVVGTVSTPMASSSSSSSSDGSTALEAMNLALLQHHVTVIESSVLLLSGGGGTAGGDTPRATAEAYLARHSIGALFEKLCTALLYHKPTDPKAFLVAELTKLKDGGRVSVYTLS